MSGGITDENPVGAACVGPAPVEARRFHRSVEGARSAPEKLRGALQMPTHTAGNPLVLFDVAKISNLSEIIWHPHTHNPKKFLKFR